MTAEYDTKAVLLDWMKEGENKHCSECRLPSPQWCSLSYGTTLCLSCSGTHRSLGVHLSFVRSLTMDKWTQPQMTRMLKGGNQKAKEFFEANGEAWKSDNLQDKYNSHTAAMYRDKLLADAEDRPWIPSDTPAPSSSTTSDSTSSSSNLRKPRAQNSALSSSSRPSYNSASPTSGAPSTQKQQNENYFAKMGSANAQRSADLPPSQGGRYSGFGSQPQPRNDDNINPLSSRALPGLDDLRDDPVRALGKGWGFLGAALGAVGKTVNESVIQPGLERAHDPNLQSQFSTFLSTATSTIGSAARTGGQVLSTGLESGSQFLKRDLGVDVGDLGAHYLDRATGRGAGEGYGRVGEEWAPTGQSRQEPGDGDFFESQLGSESAQQPANVAAQSDSSFAQQQRGVYRDKVDREEDGFREMPTVPKIASPPPPPQIEGDWNTMAPKAAAARAAEAARKQSEPAPKEVDGWDDFEDF
ncbi:uncharacterized protein JCM15063_003420 [Sporobolomyces koalae]|uniref:uncharacterized protein n=1 Tax=Sporobolomyces koalae TaxID=500713 RepID=UPI0031765342